MIEVAPSRGDKDSALVRYVLNHPKVWPHLFDEPLPATWQPQGPGVFLLARKDGAIAAVAILSPENSVTCQIHHAVLPKAWGRPAIEIGREVLCWIFANGWMCATGWTPTNNAPALRFAQSLGMEAGGICPASYEERGAIVDRQFFYMTKARWEAANRQQVEA